MSSLIIEEAFKKCCLFDYLIASSDTTLVVGSVRKRLYQIRLVCKLITNRLFHLIKLKTFVKNK